MKNITPERKTSWVVRLIRLLRMNTGLENASSDPEEIGHVSVPTGEYRNYYIRWKEMRTAMIEAKRKKAQALMEREKRRFIC